MEQIALTVPYGSFRCHSLLPQPQPPQQSGPQLTRTSMSLTQGIRMCLCTFAMGSHPHIRRVWGMEGAENGGGISVLHLSAETPLVVAQRPTTSFQVRVQMAFQLARALAYLHSQGMTHGSIGFGTGSAFPYKHLFLVQLEFNGRSCLARGGDQAADVKAMGSLLHAILGRETLIKNCATAQAQHNFLRLEYKSETEVIEEMFPTHDAKTRVVRLPPSRGAVKPVSDFARLLREEGEQNWEVLSLAIHNFRNWYWAVDPTTDLRLSQHGWIALCSCLLGQDHKSSEQSRDTLFALLQDCSSGNRRFELEWRTDSLYICHQGLTPKLLPTAHVLFLMAIVGNDFSTSQELAHTLARITQDIYCSGGKAARGLEWNKWRARFVLLFNSLITAASRPRVMARAWVFPLIPVEEGLLVEMGRYFDCDVIVQTKKKKTDEDEDPLIARLDVPAKPLVQAGVSPPKCCCCSIL